MAGGSSPPSSRGDLEASSSSLSSGGARKAGSAGHRERATSAHKADDTSAAATPLVDTGRSASLTHARGVTGDTLDSDQQVSLTEQALTQSSTAGGKLAPGHGGDKGEGAPASGGDRGAGSHTTAQGSGDHGPANPSAEDPRLTLYWRHVLAKIDPLWSDAFPHEAAIEGHGGWAILAFTILPSGAVTQITVLRPSGFPEFDRNLANAISLAAPFEPLPAALGPSLRRSITFNAMNFIR